MGEKGKKSDGMDMECVRERDDLGGNVYWKGMMEGGNVDWNVRERG